MALRNFARVAAVGTTVLAAALLSAGPALAETTAPDPPPPGGSPQEATASERAAATIRPAIAYINEDFKFYVVDQTGTPITQLVEVKGACTGFGVNPDGYIATAGHCVDTTSPVGLRGRIFADLAQTLAAQRPENDANAWFNILMTNYTLRGSTPGSPVDATYSVISEATSSSGVSGQPLPARVVDFRPINEGDVALLKIEAHDLPTAELATDSDVQIGTSVLSVGYPGSADAITDPSLEPSMKDGKISAKKTVGSRPVYETSAAMSRGMSGGPTVDMNARVTGLNSFGPPGESQPFNFIAPSTGLSELLARNGVRNQLGSDDIIFRSALDAYYNAHYTEAIRGFDHLLETHPQHPQANQYKALAAKARDRFGDAPADSDPPPAWMFGLSPTLFWAVAGGFAVVALATVLTVIGVSRTRKRRRASEINNPAHPATLELNIPTQRQGGPDDVPAGTYFWPPQYGPRPQYNAPAQAMQYAYTAADPQAAGQGGVPGYPYPGQTPYWPAPPFQQNPPPYPQYLQNPPPYPQNQQNPPPYAQYPVAQPAEGYPGEGHPGEGYAPPPPQPAPGFATDEKGQTTRLS